MRHRRQHRHPIVETAVFAAAVLLAAFIARELWSRRGALRPDAPAAQAVRPVELNPTFPPLPVSSQSPRTETAVTGVPSIKLSRVQNRRPKPSAVPAPR